MPEGESAVPNPTVPEKLLTLARFIVELAAPPGVSERESGLEEIV